MGWGSGMVEGREVGYNVEATCEHPGCDAQIDLGLGYACGGTHGEDEVSCAGYFCGDHLFYDQLCKVCCDLLDEDDDPLS